MKSNLDDYDLYPGLKTTQNVCVFPPKKLNFAEKYKTLKPRELGDEG